jgi:hypothetical protein
VGGIHHPPPPILFPSIVDEFVFVDEILEIDSVEPSRIIMCKDKVAEGPSAAASSGFGGTGNRQVLGLCPVSGEAQKPQGMAQLGKGHTKNVKFAASLVSMNKSPNVCNIFKLFSFNIAPLVIADIMHSLKFNRKSSCNNTHTFLKKISAHWGKENKERFMPRIARGGCHLDLATIMLDISYEDFDPVSTLSSEIGNTIELLYLWPDMVQSVMQLYYDLHKKSTEEKIELIKTSKFRSLNFELTFIPLAADGHLTRSLNKISSVFHLEMPVLHRRANIHKHVIDICSAVRGGTISGKVALRKFGLMAGDDFTCRESALYSTTCNPDIHHALAASWGMEAFPEIPRGKPLSDSVSCTHSIDYFQTPCLAHIKIIKDGHAHDLISKLGTIKTLYMNIRHVNDPSCFMEDPGMVSILPMGSDGVYHIFPYAGDGVDPRIIKELLTAIASKTLYGFGKSRITAALGKFTEDIKDMRDLERHPKVQQVKGKFPYRICFAVTGHSNCPGTFNSVFRDPSNASLHALLHMGAELHAASILYPLK